MKLNKILYGIFMLLAIAIAPFAVNAEELLTTQESNESVEDYTMEEIMMLEEEVDTEIVDEMSQKVETVKPTIPNGFSRFISGIGDAFTFNKTEKALRMMNRAEENKLRILNMMQEKQSGLYNSEKFSEDLEKLKRYVDDDMKKFESNLNSLSENANDEDLTKVNMLKEKVKKQFALDTLIGNETRNTIMKAKDLSSEEISRIRELGSKVVENTKKIMNRTKEKEVNIATKMIATGVKSEKLTEITQRFAENKERVMNQIRENMAKRNENGTMDRIREQVRDIYSGQNGSKNIDVVSGENSASSEETNKPLDDKGNN